MAQCKASVQADLHKNRRLHKEYRDQDLTIEFQIGGIPETPQGDLSIWYVLTRHSSKDETLKGLLGKLTHCVSHLEDPDGNMDIQVSTFMVAVPQVGGHLWNKTKKGSGLIHRCNLADTQQEVNNQISDQLRLICISPISFNLSRQQTGTLTSSAPALAQTTLTSLTQ
jgi:hypothetical protein